MSDFDTLSAIARGLERDPANVGIQLRMNLAELVVRELDNKGWSQKQLAEAAGMRPSSVSHIIHGEKNCTFNVAGRILFALELTGKLTGIPKSECHSSIVDTDCITFSGIGVSNEYGIETGSGTECRYDWSEQDYIARQYASDRRPKFKNALGRQGTVHG